MSVVNASGDSRAQLARRRQRRQDHALTKQALESYQMMLSAEYHIAKPGAERESCERQLERVNDLLGRRYR